jgi:hypothetical protein
VSCSLTLLSQFRQLLHETMEMASRFSGRFNYLKKLDCGHIGDRNIGYGSKGAPKHAIDANELELGYLIQISERASTRPARIPARSARARGRRGTGPAFRHGRKDRELRLQLSALALGTLGFVLPKDQRLELVLTLFAHVLKNRHDPTL